MREYSETELLSKAEAYCSSAERCESEVKHKLQQWGCGELEAESIIKALKKERYVDERRYCTSFAHDKYQFCGWGRVKIVMALRSKQLSDKDIEYGLSGIDEEEYASVLEKLLRQKAKTLKPGSGYELRGRLMRFASGKGYTSEEIRRGLKTIGIDGLID